MRAVKIFLSEEYFPGNSRFRLRLLDADGEVSSAALADDVASAGRFEDGTCIICIAFARGSFGTCQLYSGPGDSLLE